MGKVDAAHSLAARGFKVFPIAAGRKAPPLLNGWPDRATSDPIELNLYWEAVPAANVGIHCAGLLVIDVDTKKGGENSLARLALTDEIPGTLTTLTPSGGRHLFYRLPEGHGGVPNGVDVLGPGLDVRSTGGYVVGPGSTVEAGEYRFDDPNTPIADAPEWLVLRLGTVVPKASTATPVPDAADPVVERAREWLARQEPAVEGQGGDAHTFAVVCGLRDLGVSSEQATALLGDWNARCSPPWMPEDMAVKVNNAYRYAQNEPGAKAAQPEDFPVVQDSAPSTPAVPPAKVNRPLRLAEFAGKERAPNEYVIKGLLYRNSYAELFGEPGAGKTFVALDIAYHTAAGQPWMGCRVKQGLVLYLAYEGIGGMVKRAQALQQKYGDADVPLYLQGAAYNLRDKAGRHDLAGLLATLPEPPALIVIDTLARALMGGDENSAQDIGAFNQAVGALIEATGACVLILHHSGKDKTKGARGSSAILGAVDTELQADDNMILSHKQRDVEAGAPIGFKLVPLVVGLDADGDDITSCVIEPAQVARRPKGRLTGNAKRAFEALCDLRPNNEPVTDSEWREACTQFMSERSLKSGFFDLKRRLIAEGYIVEVDNLISRRME